MSANIKLWMITGDKRETAINIAYTTSLIKKDYESIEITDHIDTNGIFELLLSESNKIASNRYLVIDGFNLESICVNESLQSKFVQVALSCKSVICCRVSPKQKRNIVALVRKHSNLKSLSIGDGANDVPMLIEAQVGVGINGNEGTAAVSCSDFAIDKFYFIQTLLLFHGRLSYKKMSHFILYYFYKNLVLVFTEVFFSYYSAFSGMPFFPSTLPTFYNALWTSWPCLFAFALDRDRQERKTEEEIVLYGAGQRSYFFNLSTFWAFVLNSLVHGTVAFFLIVFVVS